MVEREGYSFADIHLHDLKAGNEYFEVKAYNVYNWNAPFVKMDLERYKNASWCKAKWYMLFSCKEGVYNLIGIKEI